MAEKEVKAEPEKMVKVIITDKRGIDFDGKHYPKSDKIVEFDQSSYDSMKKYVEHEVVK